MTNSGYAVVVLYYKFGSAIRETVNAFLNQSPPPELVVVVDNGSEDGVCASLFQPDECVTVVTSQINLGYSGGMRLGMRQVSVDTEFILFSTHEVLLEEDGAGKLLATMQRHSASQVGPALVNGESGKVWSYGGELSSLGAPRHRTRPDQTDAYEVPWLDGCCYLVRNNDVTFSAFDERYFLYWEDIHLSTELGAHGSVLLDPTALATQTTGTTPPYFAARNRIQFWRYKRQPSLAIIASASMLLRSLVWLARGDGLKRSQSLLRGVTDGWTGSLRPGNGPNRGLHLAKPLEIRIVNPLGAALKHYSDELVSILQESGSVATIVGIPEPSQGRGRASWILAYGRELLKSRSSSTLTISTWPALGLLDFTLIWLLAGSRSALVVHDPTPLVRATGYGRMPRVLAKLVRGPIAITHSVRANNEVLLWGLRAAPWLLPHPVLTQPRPFVEQMRASTGRPVVRVLGQWKPSRDMAAMASIAAETFDEPLRFEVVGRGWPFIAGWTTDDRFVPESELDELLSSSKVVVIPYDRFYQSGIAIRALENGRAVVGPADSSLADIYGASAGNLVSNGDWASAVRSALSMSSLQTAETFTTYRDAAVEKYSEFVTALHSE